MPFYAYIYIHAYFMILLNLLSHNSPQNVNALKITRTVPGMNEALSTYCWTSEWMRKWSWLWWQLKAMETTVSTPPTTTNLSNEVRILPCFPQGDPGGIIGPPGLPGPKGEAGPPGKSLPGEPVSTSPFSNISLESSLITTCVFPVSDHKYRHKLRSAEKEIFILFFRSEL